MLCAYLLFNHMIQQNVYVEKNFTHVEVMGLKIIFMSPTEERKKRETEIPRF